MSSDEIVSLAALAAAVFAIWLARRRAGQRNAAACSAAYARGQAELRAELAASAVAHGGSVTLQLGNGGSLTTVDGRDHHYDNRTSIDELIDNLAAALDERARVAGLRELRGVQHSDAGVSERVVGVFDGVQRGQASADSHGWDVPARGSVVDPGAPDVHASVRPE